MSIRSKNFVTFCAVLVFESDFLWIQIVCKDGVHFHFVCLCYNYGGYLSKKKPQETTGVIAVCSGLERIWNSLKIRKMDGYVKHWKVENFLCSQPTLAHD